MREIKFRAWDKIEKQILIPCIQNYWLLLSINGITHQYILGKLFGAENNYDIMQYTGLKDKNGKEIYEGDIVKWQHGISPNNDEEGISVINFDEGCFGLENSYKLNCLLEMEIIGNIYENKELIKL